MNKFQIVEVTEQSNHAGTKATADVAEVADKLGFRRINIVMNSQKKSIIGKIKRQIGFYQDWRKAEKLINNGSILLLQHPFHYPQLTRNKTLISIKQKGIKIISIVHDVEELRAFRFNNYYKNEFDMMLELADFIIVHNDVMKQWFIERGVSEKRLISLGIFDYLQNYTDKNEIKFERSIVIAGNLDEIKCKYIGKLGLLKDLKIHLYGPNFNTKLKVNKNIEYHGSFPIDKISSELNKGFGLVWDGESIDGCKGKSGQYLRYNNPHKLSLYLSTGLPVIIWKGAAEAKFVEENKIGFAVDNLYQLSEILNDIKEDDYKILVHNVQKIKIDLCKGNYINNAICNALSNLER